MTGTVLKDIEVDENGDFVYAATSPESHATTPMSKATPLSKNAGSPIKGAAPWTGSQDQLHGSPTSAQPPSQACHRQHTQKAKKGFLDTDSIQGGGHDQEADELHPPKSPSALGDTKGLFDTDSVHSRQEHQKDDLDDDQSSVPQPTSPRPAKKGTFLLSSAPPSVLTDLVEQTPPQKVLSTMRGKSAVAAKSDQPADRRKATRRSALKVQLPPLSLEQDEAGAGVVVMEDDDLFAIENIPASRGVSPSPAKHETKRSSRKRPALKKSEPTTQNKKASRKPSKPSPERKKPTRPRQKAKPSAADPPQESVQSESREDQADDASTPDEAESSASTEEVAALTKPRVQARAPRTMKQQSPVGTDKNSAYIDSDSERSNTDAGEDDDEYVDNSGAKSRTKTVQYTKKAPETRSTTTRSMAKEGTGKENKSGVNEKAKKGGHDNGGESLASMSPPKQSIETAPPPPVAHAKSQAKRKTRPGIAPPPLVKTTTVRQTRLGPEDPSSVDGSEGGSFASKSAPRLAKATRQLKTQLKSAAKDNDGEQSPGGGSAGPPKIYLKDRSSAPKSALRPAKTTSQAKTRLTSPPKDGHGEPADTVFLDLSTTESRHQQRDKHQPSHVNQPAGRSGLSKGNTTQSKTFAQRTKNPVQTFSKTTKPGIGHRVAEVIKDKERKAHIVAFGADGPKTNGKSRKKPIAGGHYQKNCTSPDSNSSDATKDTRNSPVKEGCVGSEDLSEAQDPQVESGAASPMPLPRSSQTQQEPSGTKQRAVIEESAVERSESSDSAKQERPRGAPASQYRASVAARQPSTIPEEDEESDAALTRSSTNHRNVKVQTNAALQEGTIAADNDGLQLGHDPADAFEEPIPNILDNPNGSDVSAFEVPHNLTDATHGSSLLTLDQVQGPRHGGISLKRASPEEGPSDGDLPANMHRGPTLPTFIQQPLEKVPNDTQLHQQIRQQIRKQVPISPQLASQQYSVYQQPTASQNQQSMMMKQATAKDQQQPCIVTQSTQSQVQQPVTTKQPTMKQQHSKVQGSFLVEQPVWKQKSMMSQISVPHQPSMLKRDQRGIKQTGLDWQASPDQEAPAGQLPMFKSLSQPGAGIQSAKMYLQDLSTNIPRPSKRVKFDGPESAAANSNLPDSGEHFCVPQNGYSSDDIFAPKKSKAQFSVDSGVMARLRSTGPVESTAGPGAGTYKDLTSHVQGPSELSGQRNGSIRVDMSRDTSLVSSHTDSPQQTTGSDLWRQSLMNRRAQRPVVNAHDVEQEKDNELEAYEGVGDVMQRIVTDVLRALKSKEAAVYDVVKDYQTGGSRIVHSIVATHAEERKQLIEEHEQSRVRYIHILEEARGRIQSIGAELEAFNFDNMPIH